MEIESGYFFIADITGYTSFLTKSELDHAKEILDAIFNSILEHVEAPLTVSNVEGDAIFCYAPDALVLSPQAMLDAMTSIYFEFRRQLRLMDLNTTCDCNACVNMNGLDLKIFVHHGAYVHHEVAGGTELTGADVILAHRLMKNTVKESTGVDGYGLFTQAAIDATGITDATDGMSQHVEHYEDFGDVTVYITDLTAAWEAEETRGRRVVTADEAIAHSEVFIPVSPWIAWAYATDGDVKKRYFAVETHNRTDADDRALVGIGASFHCAHELGDVDYVVVDMEPPHYFTNANKAGDISTITTHRIVRAGGGVMFQMLLAMADPNQTHEDLPDFQRVVEVGVTTLRDIIVSDLETGVIPKDEAAMLEVDKQAAARPGVREGRFGNLRTQVDA